MTRSMAATSIGGRWRGISEGGDYTVSGTIGQPDAGPLMSGGDYAIVGGFWVGAISPTYPNTIYLPLVTR